MLIDAFPRLGELKCTQLLRAFFRSPFYVFLIAALMAVSEIFALELVVYWLFLFFGALCALFGEDTLGLVPIVGCSYMTFAYKNNPHVYSETLFSKPQNLVQLFFILVAAMILLIGRLVLFVMTHPARKMPFLTIGFLVLGAAYLLSGVGYEGYVAWKALLFGAAQIVALGFFYFFFYFSVDWKKVDKEYIFLLFTAIGVGLLAEIGCMYTNPGVLKEDGSLDRYFLGTGWGVYNNVGGMMAMCLPAPFYFAAKDKRTGWAFSLLGCVFLLGVFLTQSRGSILFGCVVFIACVVALLIKAEKKNRIVLLCLFGGLALLLVGALLLFHEKLGELFISVEGTIKEFFAQISSAEGVDFNELSSQRIRQYQECWKEFVDHPFLGVGFHNLQGGGYAHLEGSVLVPPRAHNTIFQLLASGGIVALAAYLFHRGQTLWLWLRHPTYEKTIIACIVGALVLTSLLDCHFFNYGPGILYGCALAFAECTDRDVTRKKKPKKA